MTVALLAGAPRADATAHSSVAIVKSSSIPPFEQAIGAFVSVLREQKRQPEILTFDLEGDAANGPSVMTKVKDANPTVVVAVGSLATAAALADSSSLPIVFSMVLYPALSGFTDAGPHPVTGVSLDIPDAEVFRKLRQVLPKARRVGVLYHPDETGRLVEAARKAATAHGFEIVAESVAEATPLAVMDRIARTVDVLWSVADSHVFTPQTTSALILSALRHGVPLVGLSVAHVRAGAMAAFFCDHEEIGRQTAAVTLRVLGGDEPRSIPVGQPKSVRLALNLRTVRHLDLELSPDIEADAAEVFR